MTEGQLQNYSHGDYWRMISDYNITFLLNEIKLKEINDI